MKVRVAFYRLVLALAASPPMFLRVPQHVRGMVAPGPRELVGDMFLHPQQTCVGALRVRLRWRVWNSGAGCYRWHMLSILLGTLMKCLEAILRLTKFTGNSGVRLLGLIGLPALGRSGGGGVIGKLGTTPH